MSAPSFQEWDGSLKGAPCPTRTLLPPPIQEQCDSLVTDSSLKQSGSQDLSAGAKWSQGHSTAPLSAAGRSGVPSYTLGARSSSRPPRTPALALGARQSCWGAAARELRAHQDPDGCGSQGGVCFGDTMNGSDSQGAEDSSQEGGGGWQPEAVLVPLFFALIFLVGAVGNALVLAVLLRGGQAVSTTNLFILNLGVADLCFILCCVPFQATIYTLDDWVFGSLLCKAVHFLIFLTMHASSFTLAAVSLDR